MIKNRKKQDSEYSDSYEDGAFVVNEKSWRQSVIFFILCAILVVSTIAYGAVDAWATGLLSIFTGLIVILWLADTFSNRSFNFSTNFIQLPLIGLLLIGLVQLLPLRSAGVSSELLSLPAAASLSLDPYATRLFVVQLCIYTVFLAATLTFLENEKRLRIMVFTIIIFGSIMAFFGVIQSLTNTNPNSILGMRENPAAFPFATFINRHHFAAFMNMTIGLTMGLLYGNATKRDKSLLLLISLILMGIALMFSGSRGGILSMLGVIAFVIVVNLFDKKGEKEFEDSKSSKLQRNLLLIGSGLGLVIVLIGSALFYGGEDSVTRGLGLGNQADISNGRFHFWQTAWQIFIHYPIIGAGLDAFSISYTHFDTWNGSLRVEQAHNDYLQILADAGILGFICLAAFIYFLFKQGFQVIGQGEDRFRRGVAVGALGGCFGILIHSFFDFPLRTPSNAFFFLTLTALATISGSFSKMRRKRVKQRVKSEAKEAA